MGRCEQPPRTWRESLTAPRVALAIAAVGALALSALGEGSLLRLGALAIGVALLVSTVVLPSVREIEFGFPVGVKVRTAVQDREEALKHAYDRQRAALEVVAQNLCDDPEVAKRLLEAAWSASASVWRGPYGAKLQVFVLCQLTQLVIADHRLAGRAPEGAAATPLSHLPLPERLAVVLHEFGMLTVGEIAPMTGTPVDEVAAALRDGIARAESLSGFRS